MSVQNSLGSNNNTPMPLGSMLYMAATNSGKGDLGNKWLVADGRYLLRDEYADLFYWIGDVFGSTGATDFRLPQAAVTNFNGTFGLMPLPTATNDGAADKGDGGTATLTATLTESNIPPISWDGQGSAVDGVGFDVNNSVWSSVVDNARDVATNDTTGAMSSPSNPAESCLVYNTPATGCSNITTTTPALIDKTAVPVAITDTITFTGELPSRLEMRMMIKANY